MPGLRDEPEPPSVTLVYKDPWEPRWPLEVIITDTLETSVNITREG